MKKALFLHGFYASGSCPMALALKEGLKDTIEVMTPDLPLHPQEAHDFVKSICIKEDIALLIGNSNGSFLAQMVASELNIPAVLGNPHLRMSDFVKTRVGRNKYKHPRIDGVSEFVIEDSLSEEFKELEEHQFDNWNAEKRELCTCLFGERDTLARFEPVLSNYHSKTYHFPGDHTPTVDEVCKYYIPLINIQIINQTSLI